MDFNESEDADSRGRIAALEEKSNQHSHVIAILQDKVTQLSTDFGRLVGEVSALRSASAGIQTLLEKVSALKTQIEQKVNDPVVEQLSTDFSELRQELLTLKAQIAAMSFTVTLFQNQPPVLSFDSRFISHFPKIFAEFRGKDFKILWRGSRDGFKSQEFHGRCDGHANTLTVILDTEGNIFGGFTPLKWESRVWNKKGGHEDNRCKADDNQKSFLFALTNPHNLPARTFVLKAEEKWRAIICWDKWGPSFGGLCVHDNCNANIDSHTILGGIYTNDTGLAWKIVCTGSENFKVTEIAVFETTA
jgi:uncharacterized protein YdcH (DUF465 family)